MRNPLLARAVDSTVDLSEGRHQGVIEFRAGFGQLDAATRTDKQWLAKVRLERAQLLAQSGLCLVELVGGLGERAQLRDA